ncbi:MAG: UbiA family prenyltransferase [Nannocystaceae bacterium]
MAAVFKILSDVLVFRVRRLEMANLAGALSIMGVLGLAVGEVAVRVVFALLLNLLVYLNNDYCDIAWDMQAPSRDREKTTFLGQNMGAAIVAQVLLLTVLIVFGAFYGGGLLLALALGGGVCWAYSSVLKRRPGVDVIAMAMWGVAMPMVGFAPQWVIGWCLALQLGLFSAVFESIQVLRDHDEDRMAGVQTTGVWLGPKRNLWLVRGLIVVAAAYMSLFIHGFLGLVIALAALVPCRAGAVSVYWTRVRMIFGLAWLSACLACYLRGATAGLGWVLQVHAQWLPGWSFGFV